MSIFFFSYTYIFVYLLLDINKFLWYEFNLLLFRNRKGSKMNTDKRMFTTRLERETIKLLKILAATEEKSVNVLLEEAIQDLLKKYKDKV